MILKFYEKTGRRFFIYFMIGFILFVTMMGFVYEYAAIHREAAKAYEMHGIVKK